MSYPGVGGEGALVSPEMKKSELVSSDHHQMSTAGGGYVSSGDHQMSLVGQWGYARVRGVCPGGVFGVYLGDSPYHVTYFLFKTFWRT